MRLYDAHNHLHDHRLDAVRDAACADLERIGVRASVVNGTQESDWEAVAQLARQHAWIRPSFGLHPWYSKERSPDWRHTLVRRLDENPHAAIGEIGLDRWIEGHDLPDQITVFTAQLALAAERNLPVAIHCLKAWGALQDTLHEHPVPQRGILLHSYGGPQEMTEAFVKAGAYFSFSPYFLRPGKERQREVFAHLSIEHILVETDAPDMAPPDSRNPHPLRDAASGETINHPANLEIAYTGLAEIRGMTVESFAEVIEENFLRFFGR